MKMALLLGWLLASGANGEVSACRAVDLVDRESGHSVVGAEDLAFDPATRQIYLSAYDRRAVDAALDRGEALGGNGAIYGLAAADLGEDALRLSLQRMAEYRMDGLALRPHGIAFLRDANAGPLLFAINRIYVEEDGAWRLRPRIDAFAIEGTTLSHMPEYSIDYHREICSPNDLAALSPDEILVTNDHGGCGGLARTLEDLLGLRLASLYLWRGGRIKEVAKHIGFANGVALLQDPDKPASTLVAVSGTRDRQVAYYELSDLTEDPPAKPRLTVHVGDAPDNLIVGDDGALYAAALPNLFQYARFRRGESAEGRAASSVFRISDSAEGKPAAFRIWNDDGAVLSGASAALKIGSRLLIAGAYDDHIAICHIGADGP